MKTTLKEAKIKLAAIGYDIRKVDGEFQIKTRQNKWVGAEVYFTDDIHDAISTAQVEYQRAEYRALIKASQVERERGPTYDCLALERRAAMRSAIRALRQQDSNLNHTDAETLEVWLSELTCEAR